ncbi:MAG: hypothetical protein EOR85_34165 [Mesorhizobium sp.]|nr:MAG: hypothetical protein EOR79_35690 [Mesorhizobium sp.]RWM88662.1 MAG: hypothetical protein EOR85_34165 [Mesorhizobium sp.]TIM81757.1 MAG: hypothetical protein E5Y50_32010 [Mesorhizobium sp.]
MKKLRLATSARLTRPAPTRPSSLSLRLPPRHRVRRISTEAAIVSGVSRERPEERMFRLLVRAGLSCSAADRCPHAFSGGQRQRIGLARARAHAAAGSACRRRAPALDVLIEAQICPPCDSGKESK